MSTHIKALRKPTDPTYQSYLKVLEACREAGVDLPPEVAKYFKSSEPYPGLELEPLEVEIKYRHYQDQELLNDVYIVELDKLPDGVSEIRFINSY